MYFRTAVTCASFTVSLTPSGQLTCANKTVTLTAGGGLDGATYQYSAGATPNGATATVTADGPYSVTVTNPGGCSSVVTTTVSSNTAAPTASLSNNGPITCINRTVTLTAGGGGSYNFSVGATPNGNTATVTNDDLYSVTVTSVNGCTATQTTQVSSNTTAPSATLTNNGPITCTNRAVTLTAGGGGTYQFSSGATPNGNTATVINDGLYSVTVTASNGCSATQSTQVQSNTTAPSASLSNNGPITCTNRTVTLTAGGEGTYAFSAGATPNGNTATVTNEGLYSVTVTASNGCTATQTTTVTSNTTAPTASLSNDGPITCAQRTVTLTAGGGGGTYAFSSGTTPNGNTATVTNDGPYSVTVTSANGCTATQTTQVQSNTTAPTTTLSNNGPITCSQRTVTLTAGGNGTYAFSAGALASGNTATVANEGIYSVTVTATNGCTATQTTQVNSNTTAPTATLTNNGPITCAQRTVTLTAGGGGTYAFSSGATPNGNTATVTNDGLYSVTVTSANGCMATQTSQVASNTTAPTVTLINNGPITCNQRTVTLTAGGGGTYAFSNGATPNGNIATVTNEGTYSVTVTASNGCSATQISSNTTAPTATMSNNGPITCTQRTVTLTAGGGGTYQFSSGTSANGNTATVNNDGLYSVTVTSANGCSATQSTQVSSNTASPSATLSNNGPITCNQRTVTLTAGGGGTYQFSSGASANGNAATVTNDGPYSVTVTSGNGCTATQTTTVSSNTTAPNATLNNNGPLTASQPTVTLTAGGGNTYAFSSGAAQQGAGNTATVTTPGQYQVTVTNSGNGCWATVFTAVTGAVSGSSCRNGSGVISVVASGNPVKYEWYRNSINSARLTENPAQVRGTSTSSLTLVNQQVTADYYVRVTDANGSAVVYGPFRFTVNLGCNIYGRVAAEEVELKISLLGNPIQGEQLRATISGAEGKVLNVQLLDLSGKPIHAKQWQQAEGAQSVEWNMSGQASGIYLLQANTESDAASSGQRRSVKVVKQ